jgi:hypothetical protein
MRSLSGRLKQFIVSLINPKIKNTELYPEQVNSNENDGDVTQSIPRKILNALFCPYPHFSVADGVGNI